MCNNSICVNPLHLRGGTQRQNIRQCVKAGRHDAMSGVRARLAKKQARAGAYEPVDELVEA